MDIRGDIKYVGVNDHEIDLFEGMYEVPKGMAYNSYVIQDKKIAIIDTVDVEFKEQWLLKVKEVLGERNPDYLIVPRQSVPAQQPGDPGPDGKGDHRRRGRHRPGDGGDGTHLPPQG